jgi:hypothetical protein
MRRLLFCVSVAATLSTLASRVDAQGVQTGTIRGAVVDAQGLPIPGATVTVAGPAVQGSREAVTDMSGTYAIPALPPGTYDVKYELSGFTTVTQQTRVALGLTVDQNVTLRTSGITEAVNVVAAVPPPIATGTVGFNVRKEEIDTLPTARTLLGVTTIAPGLTERSPQNGNQVVINGAFAYDNVFMINGVDINDNLFAQPQNLFIEDAIEETQVLTSGISAEYGRFSGGVINAITRSGGNDFSGSYRLNLLNPAWTQETPFQVSRQQVNLDTLQRVHEGTFGGPIVRDRLWFFTAGRYGAVDTQRDLQHGLSVIQNDENKRGELKITGTVATNHTIQGGFLNNPRTVTNDSGLLSRAIDPNVLKTRSFPNRYYYTNYRGVAGGALLIEAQYSQRQFKFENSGGTSTNIVDSPFLSATQCACLYNAPYFDATDPTGRNNRQLTASVTRFWAAGGRHDTKVGYEFFRSQLVGGNSQSSTNYVFNVDFLENANGGPVTDASGRIIPNFVPGESYIEYFPAVRGATMDVNNNSAYVQDHWTIGRKLSADLGARFEQVKVVSTGDITSINTTPRLVPRLGLSYDIRGDGTDIAHATYAQYAGRYNEAQVGGNSPSGNPSYYSFFYTGPTGTGLNFAPGLNPANYAVAADNIAFPIEIPTQNVRVNDRMKTPLTHEFTVSYGRALGGSRGHAEATYIYRKTTNMIEDFITAAGGTTEIVLQGVTLGELPNVIYDNTDLARREYQAVEFQSRYRLRNSVSVNGHYTLQLRNHGNYEGEGTNLPGNTSAIGDYPEALPENRYYPFGRLQQFQRHRLRVWSVYDVSLGRLGRVATAGLWRVDSGGAYSLLALNVAPNATQAALTGAAGYIGAPATAHVYFGERGSESFKGSGLFDWSATYDIAVFKDLRPWFKFDVFNVFDNDKIIAWNTTIQPDPSSSKDAFGIPTGFVRGSSFGVPSGVTVGNGDMSGIPAYPQWAGGFNGGRTYRLAMGIRF